MNKKYFCSFTDSKVLSYIEFEQFYLFIVYLFLLSKLFIICWFQTALLLKFLIWGPINETEFSRAIKLLYMVVTVTVLHSWTLV